MAENFCCDTFWSLNETWNTDVPDFTSCFQDIVLDLIPCILFSIIGLFNLYSLSKHTSFAPLPWTWRIILKLIMCIFLLTISVSRCSIHLYQKFSNGSDSVPVSTITASFARCFIYTIIFFLMLMHKTRGVATSALLSVFWICFACCGIAMHRSIILKFNRQISSFGVHFILDMLYYSTIYIELILSFFADIKSFTLLEKSSSYEEASFFSGIFYLWYNKTVYISLKRLLTIQDFLPLAFKLKTSYIYEVFSKKWNFDISKLNFQNQSLAWALCKSVWPSLITGFILDLCYVFCSLMPPLILDKILLFVKDDHYLWRPFFYCGALFIILFISRTLDNNITMYFVVAVSQVKSALTSAIFRKNLRLASATRKDFTSGSIANLISIDVTRISNFAYYSTSMIAAAFRIVMIIFFMWQYLGVSCLSGMLVIILFIPIAFYMSRVSERFTEKQMAVKDIRLKCINEILNGIKILKFYAWEVPFSMKISKTRKEEIKFICLSQMCYVATNFVFMCAPILVSITTFATFLLIDPKNSLTPSRAFVSLNLLDQLRYALFHVPDSLSELIQTITALKRIKAFLVAEETDSSIVGYNPIKDEAISFINANLFWSKESNFVLENINMHIPVGKLVAVIGPVGSGKSSLLSAILGDMKKSSGSIDMKGTLAYVSQEAWILNRTLKNNVLLERKMNDIKYHNILDCCCLRPDLDILPGGDETEIGEKGINLSGGQKQRISLARALYQNRDIYLLDDPLSAVDAHVRKALFEDVISNQGLLKNKTRILVTHDISVLPLVDQIIRMDEGKIIEIGTYKELLDGDGAFLNFIKTHTKLDDDDNTLITSVDNAKSTYGRTISEDWVKPSEYKQISLNENANLIEDEKMEEGGVKRGIYLNYANHIGWLLLTFSAIGYIGFTTLETGSNIWVAKWSADPILNGTQDYSQTKYRISVYGALGISQAFAIILGISYLVYGSTKAAELYHSQMLERVLKSPMSFFDVTPMGRIVNRFSTDMDVLDILLIYDIEGCVQCLLLIIATFIVIGMNIPLFLACILPLSGLYFIILKLHLNTSRQSRRLESTSRSPIYSHLLESIYGVVSIKAFQVEKQFITKLEENMDNHTACYFNTGICNRWMNFWLDCISSLVVLLATSLAINNRYELGASVVGLIITYALSVTNAMMWLVRSNNELESKSVSIERVDEYCHLQSEAPRHRLDCDPDSSWPQNGEIVFDNYSTRYRENLDLVLKRVNLSIVSNEKVGIVGRTGAGKSSVTLALFRIIEPTDGTILIDNIDITNIGLHTLRHKLTIIPQDPVLFTGTLRFNLDPNDEYNDEEIWMSIANAHLKDFISSLPEGLQHNIEESGANLSAGQKQLLCLSRALLKNSKILILDEATAAVDMDTDKLVQDTIQTAFADRTVITIAHRLNTVMDYDKIVVMDSGEIAEVGSPEKLKQNKESLFHQLCKEAGLI